MVVILREHSDRGIAYLAGMLVPELTMPPGFGGYFVLRTMKSRIRPTPSWIISRDAA